MDETRICPFLSVGKAEPVTCNHNCMLYVVDSEECAIYDIERDAHSVAKTLSKSSKL